MSPIDQPFALALIGAGTLLALWFALAVHAYRRTGQRLDGALPRLLNPCPYLDCTEPADDWIYDRAMCSGHAEAIRGRSDR